MSILEHPHFDSKHHSFCASTPVKRENDEMRERRGRSFLNHFPPSAGSRGVVSHEGPIRDSGNVQASGSGKNRSASPGGREQGCTGRQPGRRSGRAAAAGRFNHQGLLRAVSEGPGSCGRGRDEVCPGDHVPGPTAWKRRSSRQCSGEDLPVAAGPGQEADSGRQPFHLSTASDRARSGQMSAR
jgi:hypothetical protein